MGKRISIKSFVVNVLQYVSAPFPYWLQWPADFVEILFKEITMHVCCFFYCRWQRDPLVEKL